MKMKVLAVIAFFISCAACWGQMDAGAFIVNYYQNPEPNRVVELLDALDAMELPQNASLDGFFLEIFKTHPFMLPAWSQKIAGLKNPTLQEQLQIVMGAVSPDNAQSIEQQLIARGTQMQKAEQKPSASTLEDFQRIAQDDPDFNWSAFFASGKKEYPLNVLKIALDGLKDKDTIDLTALAAKWSIISLSLQQKAVCDIFREHFAAAPQEELNAFFKNVQPKDRVLFLTAARLESLPPYEDLAASVSECKVSNPFAGIFSDWEHGQKTHQEMIQWLIECYVKAAIADAPQSNPETIRKMLFAYYLSQQPAIQPENIPDTPFEDEWEEMWRIECLAIANRTEAANQAAQVLYNLGCTPVFTCLLCDFIKGCQSSMEVSQHWNQRLIQAAEEAMAANHPRAPEAALWSYNILSTNHDCDKPYFQRLVQRLAPSAKRIDPWFWEMIQGKANITDAWDSRGGGWAYTVTEEKWKGFYDNLTEAKMHFEKALELHPERFNPYIALITVYMGLTSDMDDVTRVFKQVLKYDPENVSAYEKALWAMRPRWGGSIQLGRYLALEALNCPRRATRIPSFGYQCLADIVRECGGYGWQNIYLDPEVYKACKRMFDEAKEIYHAYQMDRTYQRYLFLWKMATLDYDGAAELAEHKNYLEYIRKANSVNISHNFTYPYMTPWFDDIETRLKVFTGKYAAELRAAERQLLENAEDERAFQTLKTVITNGDLTHEERNFLIDFYGRWRLDDEPSSFWYEDNNGKAKCRDILLAARLRKRDDVAQEIEALGYDGKANEAFPGQPAFVVAGRGRPIELLAQLKDQGVPLNAPDDSPEGMMPIHIATNNNHPQIIQELVRLGVPVDSRSQAGHTALHYAASSRKLDAASTLVSLGADPNAQDYDGDTCLIYLPQVSARIALYEFFLELPNINVNLANHAGDTPLHYAAQFNAPLQAVQLMLDKGANVNARNRSGRTPLDYAEARQNTALVELLGSHGAKYGADFPHEVPADASGDLLFYLVAVVIIVAAVLGVMFFVIGRRRKNV